MTCPECDAYSVTIANMSAALLGVLTPGQPYEGNPTSVSEAMRLRRALAILAREACLAKAAGRYDVDEKDVADEIRKAEAGAAAEIAIVYAPAKELPAAFRPGKEPS